MSAEVMNRTGAMTESEDVKRERLLEEWFKKMSPSPDVKLIMEQFLAEHSDLVPKGDETLKLDIEHSKRFVLAREETIRIKTQAHEPYAGGACFKQHKRLFFGQTSIALHDKNDHPIALCVQERDKSFTICAAYPRVRQDAPHIMQGEHAWFRWYQVRKTRQGVAKYNQIFVWDGTEFKHFLKALPVEKKSHELGPTEKCDIVIEDQDEKVQLAHFTKKKSGEEYKTGAADGWHLSIAPVVDPAAMLCFAIVIDYMIMKPYHT